MIDSVSPYSGSITMSQALGPINADYYYGGTDVEYNSKIRGVMDQSGGVYLPPTFDTSTAYQFFDQRIPVICFHGQQDPVIPIDTTLINFGPVDNSNSKIKDSFNTERTCLITNSFRTNGSLTTVPDLFLYGTNAFFKYILQKLNIPSEKYVDCLMKHGLDDAGTMPYESDMGTLYTDPDSVQLYMVGRTGTFFQSIISNMAQTRQNSTLTHKVFVECRNNRVKCNPGNNDAGCNNQDSCLENQHQ